MKTFGQFMDRMMYHLGYVKNIREAQTPAEREIPAQNQLPQGEMAKERATMAEAVAQRMIATAAAESGVEKEYRAGMPKMMPKVEQKPQVSSEEWYGGGGRDDEASPDIAPRPRLKFQQIHPKPEKHQPPEKPDRGQQKKNFLNALNEAMVNLWIAGFKELPHNDPVDTMQGSVSAGERMNRSGGEPEISVPIWEINPEIRKDIPESIAHMFKRETSLSGYHRVVVLLSKNPDMEHLQDVNRHLAETNVQKVLMGGPEILKLMGDYPSVILENCTQITFLLDNQNVSDHEKATLSLVQRRIQQETSIPINVECYSQWGQKVPMQHGNVGQMKEMSSPAVQPALPAAGSSSVYPEERMTGHPSVNVQGSEQRGFRPGSERPLPEKSATCLPRPAMSPEFVSPAALTASYTAHPGQKTERQPPTEKQIVHVKKTLERLGFNPVIIDEHYRIFNIPIGWVGRPVNELFTRLDRQGVSLLIDILKRIEIEHMKTKAGRMQLPDQPEQKPVQTTGMGEKTLLNPERQTVRAGISDTVQTPVGQMPASGFAEPESSLTMKPTAQDRHPEMDAAHKPGLENQAGNAPSRSMATDHTEQERSHGQAPSTHGNIASHEGDLKYQGGYENHHNPASTEAVKTGQNEMFNRENQVQVRPFPPSPTR